MKKIVTTTLTKKQIRDIRRGLNLGKEFMLLAQPCILEGKMQVIHLNWKEFEFLRRYIKHLGFAYKAKKSKGRINTKFIRGSKKALRRER